MINERGEYYLDHPVETVFSYMRKPENAAKVAPSLEDSRAVREADVGGYVVEADYDVGGLIDGSGRLYPVIFEENDRIKYEIRDKFTGHIDWKFTERNGGTVFVYEAQIDVDIPLPNFIVSKVSSMLAQEELDAIIENLRTELSAYEG